MKSIKMALLGSAALAVTAATAHADDLDALKAQIETLNARVAAMEAAPSVPSGYSLLAVQNGTLQVAPDLEMSQSDRFTYGNTSTVISVLPTADAPAGATISWSGQVRSGIVYSDVNDSTHAEFYNSTGYNYDSEDYSDDGSDTDVKAQGRLRVVAATDTAVGEVGVQMELRADFNGVNTGRSNEAEAYFNEAWGWWAVTPELTLGGGYTGSLGNIGYGYDGACSCVWTDAADLAFDPGDTTQMRLTYKSGPLTAAIALEDAGIADGLGGDSSEDYYNYAGDQLGVAGELKYSGDTMSGEISGIWRAADGETASYYEDHLQDFWQVGGGLGFSLGDMTSLSIAGAFGEGPHTFSDDTHEIYYGNYASNGSFWGVTALASVGLNEAVHAEIGAGYKHRDSDGFYTNSAAYTDGFDYDTWAVMGGLYYTPVEQLTIGLEGEWQTADQSYTIDFENGNEAKVDHNYDRMIVDLAAVFRF